MLIVDRAAAQVTIVDSELKLKVDGQKISIRRFYPTLLCVDEI